MKALRTALFWGHLAAGCSAGAVILALCATGFLLAFQPQVLSLVERRARKVPRRPATALGAGTLLRLAAEESGGRLPASLRISSDPAEAAVASLSRERALFLDPGTGAVLGASSPGWRAFFAKVQDVHRWLAFADERRDVGKTVTGSASVAFLALALTGLYIWWPRLRGIRRASSVGLFRRGLSGKARDFNWHNVIGVWTAPAIVVLTVTALPMSFRWANDLVFRVAGGAPPRGAGPEGGARSGRDARGRAALSAADADALDRLWQAAAARSPGWRAITLRPPERRGAPAVFAIEEGVYANRFARSTLALDPRTGAAVRWEPYGAGGGGRRVRSWMRFLHTGEALGLGGQIAAALACVGGGFLVVTGISLALRRLSSWGARRAAAAPESLFPPRTGGEADLAGAKGEIP